MPLPPLHYRLPTRTLPFWSACLLAAALLASTHSTTFGKPTRGKKTALQPLPPPEMDRNASRFILPENQKQHLENMLTRMSMSKRAADPFGLSQDPNAAPAIVATPDPSRQRIAALQQKIPLQQVVSLLKVSTIIPSENRFLITGGRSFQVGDTIPLTYRAKKINARVVSVSTTKILFQNSESDETATLEMKLLPPGMQPGTTLSEAPGLFRNEKEEPINLDASGLP